MCTLCYMCMLDVLCVVCVLCVLLLRLTTKKAKSRQRIFVQVSEIVGCADKCFSPAFPEPMREWGNTLS
jgi:hypothetical protein